MHSSISNKKPIWLLFCSTCLPWRWSKTRSLYSAHTVFFGGSLPPSTSFRNTDSEFPFPSPYPSGLTSILLKEFGEPKLTTKLNSGSEIETFVITRQHTNFCLRQ